MVFPVIDQLRAVNAYGGTMKRSDGSIGVCSRTGDVVEPMVKEQWFMDCTGMNQRALEAIEKRKVFFSLVCFGIYWYKKLILCCCYRFF